MTLEFRMSAINLLNVYIKTFFLLSYSLLLFDNGSHLKLCDFGTCRNLETNLLYTASIGTVRYMAPEVIQGTLISHIMYLITNY